jgi:5-hydroxyisourate hydrolase-like protein (transthyretin family)
MVRLICLLELDQFIEPATIEFTDATGVTYIDVSFTEDHTQIAPIGLTVNGAAITELLDQGYWTIAPDAVGSSTYNITVQSVGHTNGGASADQYAIVTDVGSGWQDLGTHSSSTQIVEADTVLAKRSDLTVYGNYMIGKSEDDTYQQPLITDELRNEGVYLKLGSNSSIAILGDDASFTNDSTATTSIDENSTFAAEGDINNNESSTISINGELSLTGNWTNNAVADLSMGDAAAYGSVLFNGTAQQNISGSSTTIFEDFTVNNSEGIYLENDIQIANSLSLTNGLIATVSNRVITESGATLTNYSENSYISGNLRRYVSTGNYPLPVGNNTYFEYAQIDITNSTGLTYIDASFNKDNTQIPPSGLTVNGAAVTEFLNYGYWTITPDNAGSSQYNITVQSIGHSNGDGTADQYSVITDRGSGWEDLGNHSPATQQINGDSIIAKRSVLNDYGNYIVGKTYEDTYVQPLITKTLQNDGVYIKIAATEQLNVVGTDAQLINDDSGILTIENTGSSTVEGNVVNDNSSNLNIDGTLNLTGDFTNNALADISDGDGTNDGTLVFNGTETQTINGTTSTQFENLTINNTQNVIIDSDQEVTKVLNFSDGLIETGANTLIVSNTIKDAITGYDENKYIYGKLRRFSFIGDTIFFPIGTESYFEEAYVNLNSQTGLTYFDISFTKDNTQTPPVGLTVSSAIINEFLNYGYWTLTANGGMSAIDYDITVISSGHTNGVVTGDSLALIADVGSGWQDIGTHSSSTQSINGIYTKAKRSNVTQTGSFIIGASNSPTYDQPTITDEIRVKEGYMKVASGQLVVDGPYAALNSGNQGIFVVSSSASTQVNGDVNLSGSGSIQLDGTLTLTKDWTNDATSSLVYGDGTNKGTVEFAGTLEQTIGGTSQTYFENLEINNSNNIVLSSIDARIDEQLVFTNGLVSTGAQKVIINNTGNIIIGFGANSYIDGNLRQYVTTSSYDLPVGTADEYELAQITIATATDLGYIDVSYTQSDENPVPVGLTVNGTAMTDFLDYGYWTIAGEPGYSNLSYILTLNQRGHSDLGGPAERYAVVSQIPAGSGWDDYGNHSPSTQTYSGSVVSAKRSGLTAFGDYIIARGLTDLYLQPTITDEIRNIDTYLKVNGSLPLIASGTNVELNNSSNGKFVVNASSLATINGNINNLGSSTISLDGTLELTGDWTNDATADLTLTGGDAGTVKFSGTDYQTIDGTTATLFENLLVNNNDSIVLANNNHTITNELQLSSGLLATGVQTLIITNTATNAITGYSSTSYVKGTLRKYVTTGSYDLPIGTTDYSQLANINIASATDLDYIDISFTRSNENPVPGGLTVNSQPITNFTDYGYWTIVGEPGYSNLNYTFTGTIRGHTDLGPTSERYAILSQIPSTGAWSDNGNHSTSTQTYNTSFVTAARSGLSGFGDYIIGKGATSLYFQPPITEEFRIKEANVKISGGQNVSVQGSNVELNNASNSQLTIAASGTLEIDGAFNNHASATVSADGDISLSGDWVNNGNASTTLGDNTNYGTVTFNGTAQQSVGGSIQTTFENLTINNTNDLLISGVDAEIRNILTLTSGLIETGAQKVIISNSDASAIAGYNDTKYINGTLRRYVTTGSYDLPIGTSNYYELANLNIATSTGLNYVDARFVVSNENPVPGGLTVNGQPITNFADYGYWNIEGESGYTAVNYILTATIKGHTDLGATSERYAIISQIPNNASWADNGTHSPSTQIYNANYVTAKRTALTGFGDFIIAKGSTALYNQPAITEELRIKNAIVRVNGSLPINIQGTNAILNGESGTLNVLSSSETIVDGEIAMDATSTIALDGTLSVTGDITNNGTADFSLGDATHKGNIAFNGSSDQSILGSTASVFENMTIDNGNSVILGATDISISEELIFTDGIITTNANMVVVTNNATSAISGYGVNNFINGNLRRYVTTNTYDLPVGTSTTYELATIEIAAATDLNYIDAKYIQGDQNPVPGGLTVNGNIINNFLNYGYWNIEGEAGYSNLTYTITLSNRGHTDLGGNAEQYAVLSQIPNTAAWADNGVHSVSSQTYSASVVTAKRSYLSAFGDFIIGKGSTALYLQPLITDELMVIGANLKVTGSELNVSGPSAEINNTETSSIKVNSGATINLYGDFNNLTSSTIGLDGNFNIDGIWTNNATASTILGDATNKGTVTFNGNTAQTIAGSSTTIFENLIIDNTANLNLSVNAQIEENLTFTNGSLLTGAQQVIINNVATNAISGFNTDNYIVGNLRRYVNTNSFKLPIGTSDYLQLVEIDINSATGLNYLDINYTESTVAAPVNLQVNGNYIVKFLDHGYWTIAANAGVTAVDYDITAHNFGHTNASALALNHSLISNLGNGWADNGTHSNLTQQIDNDTVIATRTNINTANSDFFGNYIIGVFGDPFNIPVTEELNNIAGIFSVRNNGTLTVNGTSASINNQDIGTFNIASGSTLDLNGSFVNESASTLNIEGNLNVYQDFTNNANMNLSTGTISFVGTTDQTIGGTFTTNFGTLTINKPTGDVLLNNDIEVSSTINLTSNDIILNNYDLTFDDGVTINAPGNNSSYIQVNGSGRVVQSFASAPSANITIPIGDDSDNYSPISFRLNSATLGASPSVSFGVTATAHPNLEATDAYIKRFWSFNETDISDPNYNVSIQYVDADIVGDENTLIFGKYSGTTWSYSSVPATIATNTIIWNNVTSFSDGTGLKNPTPLPVELYRFTADYLPETRNVAIKWITLSELQNDYFTLEKSRDGSLFMPLKQVDGAGNSSIMLEYNVEDDYPYTPITYYRLKQTDFDGTSEYSHITSATIEDNIKAQVQLYPNPARVNEPIQIMIGGLLAYSKVMVEIYNDGGQFILDHAQYVPETGKTTIEINTNNRLHSGTYIVLIKTKFETFKKQIVIK